MPTLTVDRFDYGLDVTKAAAVADANRMRVLNNAYVTTGRAIRKRNGFRFVATLEPGTAGLVAHNGKLNTFYGSGTITHANTLFKANKVANPVNVNSIVTKLHFGEAFNNAIYCSVEYADGLVRHHYLDGTSPTHIVDASCPHTKACAIQSKKVFAIGRMVSGSPVFDSVSFSRTDAPRDWSTLTGSDAAGFLPTGLQGVSSDANALGRFRSQLAVYGRSWMQTWTVSTNPANMAFADSISGVGTAYPRSVGNVGPDVFFLADIGIRSATTITTSGNLSDRDIGTPIDKLIKEELVAIGTKQPLAFFHVSTSQYWLFIGVNVWVFTFSRSAKIAAWSKYTLPFSVDSVAELNGVMYVRSGNDVYNYDETLWADNGVAIASVVKMPYLGAKSPTVLKQFYGLDMVMTGTADVSFAYDVRNESFETTAYQITGATTPGDLIPVEVVTTEMSPIFSHSANEEWTLDSISLHFHALGNV